MVQQEVRLGGPSRTLHSSGLRDDEEVIDHLGGSVDLVSSPSHGVVT